MFHIFKTCFYSLFLCEFQTSIFLSVFFFFFLVDGFCDCFLRDEAVSLTSNLPQSPLVTSMAGYREANLCFPPWCRQHMGGAPF